MNKCPQCFSGLSRDAGVCKKCGFRIIDEIAQMLLGFGLDENQATRILAEESMTPEKWQKIKGLFEAAQDVSPDERKKFLKNACGDDGELRAEIEKLLASADKADSSFLEEPAAKEVATEILENDTRSTNQTTGGIQNGNFVAGTVLDDRYRIIGLLGKGGMGEVYRAEDLKLSQVVALKFLPENLEKNEDALRRFISEVRTARQVSHPNVCKVFDIGDINGKHFLSMEFIDGDDLSILLKRIGRLPAERAIEISRQICMGLNAIHKAGILHRDLKPANIIIDSDGRAKITDFGIAGFEVDVQGSESRVGTPAYMSPEQITGKEVTQKSDIYSLGLLIYEIFTGKQAFDGESLDELIRKHGTTNPTNASELVENIDPLVEKVINRCLEKIPENRPSSAVRVALALPGGNPLEVALEAGETPSPEMVAAAPRKGILKPSVAVVLTAFLIGTFFLGMYFVSIYTDAGWSPIYKSSDVLNEQAKSILRNFGYLEPRPHSASHFQSDPKYDFYITTTNSSDTLEKYKTGQPAAVYFWYRQSFEVLTQDGMFSVSETNPSLSKPGSEYIKLDLRGRLITLVAAPSKLVIKASPGDTTDWKMVFEQAGLNIAKFSEITSEWTPPVFADTRHAWKGTLADHPDIQIRVEAASYRGNPVFFSVVPPWDDEQQAASSVQEGFNNAQNYLGIGMVLCVLFGGLFLGYRNLKARRGDLRGALKIAAYFFVCGILGRILVADHVAEFGRELMVIFAILRDALWFTAILVVLYLAVEPLVRRWWPELLISWNRLLSGELRDPIIGRDILIGGSISTVTTITFFIAGFIRDNLYSKQLTRQATYFIDTLSGTRNLFGYTIDIFAAPILTAFGVLTVFLVSYLIFRRKWLGTIALAFVWSGLFNIPYFYNRGAIAASIGFVVGFVVVFLYARFGLVTIIASSFFTSLSFFPITFDPARPYFLQSMVILAIGIALAIFSFFVSIGDQNLLDGKSLDPTLG